MKPLIPFALVGVVAATTNTSQNPLEVLGTTLGLSALAGINLYLTVFVTGLAINAGWLTNYPPALSVLGNEGVIILAGVLYALEFFADKVPWVDSLWDTIHTVIRPIGGAFLAIKGLGTTDPMLDVVAGLLGGSVAFCTHSTKAGTRLLVNHSPEPFSNIALSVAEDVAVVGGSWLAFQHPIVMLVGLTLFLIGFIYFGPKVFRMLKAESIWVVSRLRQWFGAAADGRLKLDHQQVIESLPPRFADKMPTLLEANERLLFTIPAFSGRMPKIGRYTRGAIVGSSSGRLWYLGRKNLRVRTKIIALTGATVEFRKRFLFDEILIRPSGQESCVGLRFGKHYGELTSQLTDWLRSRCAKVEMPVEEPSPAVGALRGTSVS